MLEVFRHQFSSIATVWLLQSLRLLQIFLLNFTTDMPYNNRNEKVTLQNCGTQTTKRTSLVTRRVVLQGHCIVPSVRFSAQNPEMIQIFVLLTHSASKPDVTIKCKVFNQVFPGFYALRQQENTQRGCPNRTKSLDLDKTLNEVDDANLKEKFSCAHFAISS